MVSLTWRGDHHTRDNAGLRLRVYWRYFPWCPGLLAQLRTSSTLACQLVWFRLCECDQSCSSRVLVRLSLFNFMRLIWWRYRGGCGQLVQMPPGSRSAALFDPIHSIGQPVNFRTGGSNAYRFGKKTSGQATLLAFLFEWPGREAMSHKFPLA